MSPLWSGHSQTTRGGESFFSPRNDGETNDGDDEGWEWAGSIHLKIIDWSSEIDFLLPWKQRPLKRVRNARRVGVGG